jgi:hypothetical protein
VGLVFSLIDLRQSTLRGRVDRLRQRGEDVADLVPPAPLLFRVGEDVAQRFPEPQCAVASICRAPLRPISSSSDELTVFSLNASAS